MTTRENVTGEIYALQPPFGRATGFAPTCFTVVKLGGSAPIRRLRSSWKKVAVDQFVYSVLFAVPFAVYSYEWKNRDFQTDRLGDFFTAAFYKERILPATVANWGVWIPGTTLIYSLPPLLQIPLFSLALTFWALILAYISSSGAGSPDAPPV